MLLIHIMIVEVYLSDISRFVLSYERLIVGQT